MLKHFSLILFLILGLAACKQSDGNKNTTSNKALPSSTGGVDEIMFVYPDHYDTKSFDNLIDENFRELYKMLPQATPRFKISTVKASQMNSLLYRFRNTIFITTYDGKDPIVGMANEALGAEKLSEIKPLYFKRNIWAKNQLVTFLIADNFQSLPKTIEQYAENIKSVISDSELNAFKSLTYINGVNTKIKEQLAGAYGFTIDIPLQYKIADNEMNFVSFRTDTEKSTIFMFFDVKKYDALPEDINKGLEWRNERGSYVSSNLESTYMETDTTLGFFTTRKEKDNFIIYETRGLWTMVNDFMGGPFINQYIIDIENNQTILLDGFVFGPREKNKLKLMREFEAIFSTFKRS